MTLTLTDYRLPTPDHCYLFSPYNYVLLIVALFHDRVISHTLCDGVDGNSLIDVYIHDSMQALQDVCDRGL
jgi:hypothetical protein